MADNKRGGVTGAYKPSRNNNTNSSPTGESANVKKPSAPAMQRRGVWDVTRRSDTVKNSSAGFDFKALFSSENMRTFTRHLVFYGCIIFVSLLLAILIINTANDVYAFIKPNNEILVTIEEGSSLTSIASALKSHGVIGNKYVFILYSRLKKANESFKFGDYTLNSNMAYSEIISTLKKSAAKKESVKFTIPEGYEQRQIVDLLVSKGYCDKSRLEDILQNYDFEMDFLEDLPDRRDRLEGYLFPDTYEIFKGEDEASIVKRLLKNFETKVLTDENRQLIDKSSYSLDELITLASIVEREGQKREELPIVASVFYNRMNSDNTYGFLQSCATIQYILPERKAVLSIADTKTDNPYNTYMYKGLPPGPIACPGLDAIEAVLEPDQTEYYYFVSDKNGGHLFAKTYEQHNSNIKKAGTNQGTGTVG